MAVGSVGAFFFYFNQKTTNYTLIPEDTNFYLALSVKKHPQVQKLLDLSKKMPGGEKMVKQIDKYRSEIFGTRKDPFKDILDLAETEVFLAKISPDEQETGRFAVNTLERLVNIVEFKDERTSQKSFSNLENKENIITTKEAYGSAKIANFQLKEQKREETSQTFSTGPLPYQVTLPLSKSIFAMTIDKFIVAAEKESDVKKIIDLVTSAKEKKMKNITTDKEHMEIASHFPKEYFLKFYQRQVLDPFSNITPGTTLPQAFFLGQSYDTRERSAQGNNIFTTKRGLTIVAQNNGVDFTSYQLTKRSKVTEGLKHGFTIDSSLANKLPAVFNSNQPLFYAEARNIKDSIQDQLDQLEDVAKNSSDDEQRRAFESSIDGVLNLKKKVGDLFNVDTDSDLLSWMDSGAATIVAPGFGGKPPEVLFIFEIKEPQLVAQKLAKIRLKNFIVDRTKEARDSAIKSDVSQLATASQAYYTTPGGGRYPNSLNDLADSGDIKIIPKTPAGEPYGYLRCTNGQEAAIFAKVEEINTYWAWSSVSGRAGYINQTTPPQNCNFTVTLKATEIEQKETQRIEPIIETYQDNQIYSFPIYDFKGDQFALRFTVTEKLAVFSVATSDQSLREIIDFKDNPTNTLAKSADWQEQFARAPKNIGGIVYIIPENVMGVVDYFLTKEEKYKQYIEEDWMTIARGYLKSLKSIGTTTTQEGKTIISNTFVNIESLGTQESKKVEEALDRVFDKTSKSSSGRISQARDSARKSDVGQIATGLQFYFTDKKLYPNSLNELTPVYMKQIPKMPDGSDYGYLICANGKEAALYTKLEASSTYWVWSSVSGRAVDMRLNSPPGSCNVFGAKSGFNLWNLFR